MKMREKIAFEETKRAVSLFENEKNKRLKRLQICS